MYPGKTHLKKSGMLTVLACSGGVKMRDFGCVIRTDHTVGMVTDYVMKKTTTCSPIVGQFFDTMFVALSDKEWL